MPAFPVPYLLKFLSAVIAVLAVSQPALAQMQVASQRDDMELRATTDLPQNPTPPTSTSNCGTWPAEIETAAGQSVASAGWTIIDEFEIGAFTFVSFAGQVTARDGMRCLFENGHVGIFSGADIVALASTAAGSERAIGSIEILPDQGGVRIFDGNYHAFPMADLRVQGGNMAVLGPLAARDSFCGGRIEVPGMYGQPIHEARALLLSEGWIPSEQSEEYASDAADRRYDFPEFLECYEDSCSFEYARADDQTVLHVSTDETRQDSVLPPVSYYGVDCE
ncbi:MAG: hypothetical protein DI616_01035 [Paracoccus denitrificans]|uniref:Uncharacterized protein n=1 Tax=Paracoccus denitrificans TaxID=266 RepID=A0A533IEQ2_PARDE|nr:MAG: hypothetical protein DI616_01035 [Paracoccus denitrificans]